MAFNYINDEEMTITSDLVLEDISYYKPKDYFMRLDNYVNFIKSAAKLVRKHPDYDHWVNTIREEQVDHCQVLGNISRYDAELQVHHGPLFTLFDYCMIVLNYLLAQDYSKITTFKVAELVILEHVAGHVQGVVLCKTVHQLIDTGEVFINLNQGIGNINAFIDTYKDGLDDKIKEKINNYIDMSEKFDSNDNDILKLENKMISWSYRRMSSNIGDRI